MAQPTKVGRQALRFALELRGGEADTCRRIAVEERVSCGTVTSILSLEFGLMPKGPRRTSG